MSDIELNNQEKLDELYHLTLENNEILRSIRRRENVELVLRLFYWFVILVSLGGIYFFVTPIINKFKGGVSSINSTSSSSTEILQKIFPQEAGFGKMVEDIISPTSTSTTP